MSYLLMISGIIVTLSVVVYGIKIKQHSKELLDAINTDKKIVCKYKDIIAKYPKEHIIGYDRKYVTFYSFKKFKHKHCKVVK